jgi:hypothetical protein
MAYSTLNRRGKKTAQWEKVRAELKKECLQAGVTWCELRIDGCQGTQFLSFAHSKKRRNITTDEGIREACLACQSCHSKVELMPESEMGVLVRAALVARE